MVICSVRHDVTRFTWKDKVLGTAEVSDLYGENKEGFKLYGRVYNDAADVGFILQNPKTGNEAVLFLTNVEKDFDGDIKWWTFLETLESMRKRLASVGLEVTVFND